jgi:hypothetical protein
MVRSEGNMSLKNPVTPPGIDPRTVQLVAWCLNHYATPGPSIPRYCCPNHHTSTSRMHGQQNIKSTFMFHSWKQTFRIIGFPGHSPNINPFWWWEQSEGWLIWPYYIFPVIRRPEFIFIIPSSCLSALFSVIRSSATAGLPSMLDWWSSRQTVFVETGSSRWTLHSTVTFATVGIWFLYTTLFNVRRSLSLSFGFQTLFLLADNVFPWFVYADIT